MNETCRSTSAAPRSGVASYVGSAVMSTLPLGRRVQAELFDGTGLVGRVLQHDAQRAGDRGLVEVLDAKNQQGAGPVDALGDARRLLQLQPAQRAHRADQRL